MSTPGTSPLPAGGAPVEVAGEHVVLLPDRAAWWPRRAALLVADVHWGKEETFRAHGVPLPDGGLEEGLSRLERLVDSTRAARVVVLGDLVHSRVGLTREVVDRVARWRDRSAGLELVLVRGNHDRHAPEMPATWRVTDAGDELLDGPFALLHEPRIVPGRHAWTGHLHPMARLRTRTDALLLPCFHLGRDVSVLPAFTPFSSGVRVRPGPGETVHVIAGDRVLRAV